MILIHCFLFDRDITRPIDQPPISKENVKNSQLKRLETQVPESVQLQKLD